MALGLTAGGNDQLTQGGRWWLWGLQNWLSQLGTGHGYATQGMALGAAGDICLPGAIGLEA